MFGLFKPKCPIELEEKVWTERRMRWLADRLGIERLLRAELLLPTSENFPELFGGEISDPHQLCGRLAGLLHLQRPIELELLPEEELGDDFGLTIDPENNTATIRLKESLTGDPPGLIYAMIHELARALLVGQGYLTGQEADRESVLDLAALFHGLGVFGANTSLVSENRSDGLMHSWSIERRGSMPSSISGYALALFCHRRGETSDAWDTHLRLDARDSLRQGLKFLNKSGDTVFRDDDRQSDSPAAVADRLKSSSPSVRLDELWTLVSQPAIDETLVPALRDCARHRHDTVRLWTARVLQRHPALIPPLSDDVIEGLIDPSAGVRMHMFAAIGQPDVDLTPFVDAIESRLELDENRSVRLTAARAISYVPNCPDSAIAQMLKFAKRQILDGRVDETTVLLAAVLRAAEDGEEQIRNWLWDLEGDPMLASAQECHELAQAAIEQERAGASA